jgi:hypothetical protein
MTTRIKLNSRGIQHILQVECAPHITRLADRIATNIVGLAGVHNGRHVEARRDDSKTGERFRAAIILQHPSPAGRAAANESVDAALLSNGGLL